jgi:hypothetical protein
VAQNRAVIDPTALPDRGNLMLLMAILPMMLIGTILVVTEIDSRGLLGPPRRKVSLRVPLSAIAGGLALGAAAIHLSKVASQSTQAGAIVLLAVISFQIGWGLVHLLARNAVSATVGMVGTGFIVGSWLIGRITAPPGMAGSEIAQSDMFLLGFEVALILALVPQVAPSLAGRLAERQMKVHRAVVLSGFCLAVTALFASLALVG